MAKATDLDAIKQERVKMEAALAAIIDREKQAEAALRDAGRPVLIAALERVKIAELDRADAKAIASAIAKYGGAKVAELLGKLAAD